MRRVGGALVAYVVYQLRLFLIALQFFTRIPIPTWVGFEPAWLQASVRYFPAIGLVVAMVSASVYWLLAHVLPQAAAVLLSTIASIYLTGAFHEDGFADMCDGFGGGMTRERVLEIMQDSRVGAYGAIGIALMLGLKCTLLSLLPAIVVVPVLLLVHPASRLAACSLIWCLAYVKAEGKAKPLAQQISNIDMLFALLPVALIVLVSCYVGVLGVAPVALAFALALMLTCWMGRGMQKRIGGFTGDCLGATQQVVEVAMYAALLAGYARPALT